MSKNGKIAVSFLTLVRRPLKLESSATRRLKGNSWAHLEPKKHFDNFACGGRQDSKRTKMTNFQGPTFLQTK